MNLQLDDAWDFIPLEFVDDALAFIQNRLQPDHPLKGRELFPVARRFRQDKYLLEDNNDPAMILILNLGRKRRSRGATIYDFKEIRTQEELDTMMRAEYEEWVQFMKDAGAWSE